VKEGGDFVKQRKNEIKKVNGSSPRSGPIILVRGELWENRKTAFEGGHSVPVARRGRRD